MLSPELYVVDFLTSDGGTATVQVLAWHEHAAERTVAHLHGGSFHTARLVEDINEGDFAHA